MNSKFGKHLAAPLNTKIYDEGYPIVPENVKAAPSDTRKVSVEAKWHVY